MKKLEQEVIGTFQYTAKHPVLLSLCTQEDLDEAIIKAGGSVDAQMMKVFPQIINFV